MKSVLFLTALAFAGTASAATTLVCKSEQKYGSSAVLTFEGNQFVSAVFKRTGLRGHGTVVVDADKSKLGTGQNSAQVYQYIETDFAISGGFEMEASVSYMIKENGKTLSLEQSLLGSNQTDGGEPYGKLRLDLNPVEDLDDAGYTIIYTCSAE